MQIKQKLNMLLPSLLISFILMSTPVMPGSRGVTVKLRTGENPSAPVAEEVNLYSESHALVIGIDNYVAGWPRLSNAVYDATLVADQLRLNGFEVSLKTDLDANELKQTFEEFFIIKGENPQSRLFVWFAGHGHTLKGEGFIVPVDAPKADAGTRFRLKALSMRRFGEYVRLARSKHILAIFDSCFSGTIFTTQRSAPPAAVTRATTLPVRQFLSSGDARQQVSDDGMFRKLFVRSISGNERADANGDGYLTGSELGLFLSDRMTNLTRSAQTPRYGKLRDPDFDRGDFVFLLHPAGVAVTTAGKTADTLDAERRKIERERLELERLRLELERRKLESEKEQMAYADDSTLLNKVIDKVFDWSNPAGTILGNIHFNRQGNMLSGVYRGTLSGDRKFSVYDIRLVGKQLVFILREDYNDLYYVKECKMALDRGETAFTVNTYITSQNWGLPVSEIRYIKLKRPLVNRPRP